MNPKYTIIIPHKNIPDLLSRCLSSIPDTKKFQVIIVDDASDANNIDFENFPGSQRTNTEIYFTKEGKGAGYARNIGLKHAKGKWLIFADSDDFFNPCFETAVDEYFDSDTELIYFSASSVNSETLTPSQRHIRTEAAVLNYNEDDVFSVENVKFLNWEPWAKMFKHNFIKLNNIFFDEVMVGNDAGFVLKAGHLSKTIAVDRSPIYCVTTRSDSLSFDDSELSFDNQYKAILLVNNHFEKLNKGFFIPIKSHIIIGRKYGPMKIIHMIFLARNHILNRIKHKARVFFKLA